MVRFTHQLSLWLNKQLFLVQAKYKIWGPEYNIGTAPGEKPLPGETLQKARNRSVAELWIEQV
jgi:hypothetical protein